MPNREDYLKDPVFQALQFQVRQAYEEGYRAGNPKRGVSVTQPTKGAWFDGWLKSQSRAFLLDNGLMTGKDDYK